MEADDRVGVLVMAHGTPATPEGIEPFYTRIRRGRPPSPEQLADLHRRYDAIGGTSPLAARTRDQVAALADALEVASPGRYVVRYGAKHTDPSIEEAATDLAATGVKGVVGLVLTPHRSQMGSGEYLGRAGVALATVSPAPDFVGIDQWWDAPGFAELWAERVESVLSGLPATARHPAVVFTAHSLPARVVDEGDPYPDQLAGSAEAIANAAGLAARGVSWHVAWQSAGRTPEPWLGPDLLVALADLAAQDHGAVVVCPVGFVADHLEVLYDLDVEARAEAASLGLVFARADSLNDDPRFIDVLAGVVAAAAGD